MSDAAELHADSSEHAVAAHMFSRSKRSHCQPDKAVPALPRKKIQRCAHFNDLGPRSDVACGRISAVPLTRSGLSGELDDLFTCFRSHERVSSNSVRDQQSLAAPSMLNDGVSSPQLDECEAGSPQGVRKEF